MIRAICNFLGESGERPVQDFIAGLDIKHQKKILKQLSILAADPDPFHPPAVKAFMIDRYKGLYELRTRIKQMVRIIFFVSGDGSVILLHGFVKHHDRATEQALEIAKARQTAFASGGARIELFRMKEARF